MPSSTSDFALLSEHVLSVLSDNYNADVLTALGNPPNAAAGPVVVDASANFVLPNGNFINNDFSFTLGGLGGDPDGTVNFGGGASFYPDGSFVLNSGVSGDTSGNLTVLSVIFSDDSSQITAINGTSTIALATDGNGASLTGLPTVHVLSGTLSSGTDTQTVPAGVHPWVQNTNTTSLTNVGPLSVSVSGTTATIDSTNLFDTSTYDLFYWQ